MGIFESSRKETVERRNKYERPWKVKEWGIKHQNDWAPWRGKEERMKEIKEIKQITQITQITIRKWSKYSEIIQITLRLQR